MNGQALPRAAVDAAQHAVILDNDDAVNCLRHLLSAEMRDGSSVGSVIERAWDDRSLWRRLGECGLRRYNNHLAICHENWFLSGVFVDTDWCLEYGDVLAQFDGAHSSVEIAQHNKKIYYVELPREVIELVWLG